MATIHIMKPFNLEESKVGKPVCTRDGRKARIICFDAKRFGKPIIALIYDNFDREDCRYYPRTGKIHEDDNELSPLDLMMAEETECLPTSWEEFCTNYPIKDSEFYISEFSAIRQVDYGNRVISTDCNLLRTNKQAEAMLAFIQLIRLRDVYRQGWEPDWTKEEYKYGIEFHNNSIIKDSSWHSSITFSFQSREIRDKFLENFRELIETAKEFI